MTVSLARMCVHKIIKYSVSIKIRIARLEIQLKSFILSSFLFWGARMDTRKVFFWGDAGCICKLRQGFQIMHKS